MAAQHLHKLEWLGNVLLWISGILISIYPDMAKSAWQLFAIMLLGQLFWATAALHIQKWSLFASSVFFAGLNIYGMWVRW